jgi:hypothetical protein
MAPDDYTMVAEACTEYNFAVIRNATTDLDPISDELTRYIQAADRGEGWRRPETNLGLYTRDSARGDTRIYSHLFSVVADAAIGIANAAAGGRYPRVDIGPKLASDVFIVNTFPVGSGYIGRHWDNNFGIAFAFNAEGIGAATLTDYTGKMVATTDLEPGDMLVLPAKVGDYGGPQQQAWHEVVNKTPPHINSGIRRSLATTFKNSAITEI